MDFTPSDIKLIRNLFKGREDRFTHKEAWLIQVLYL
uniref:Uncharacterized protein n=1 Tax=Sphingobacterium sp. (strain 21) TaxID=743722 RepID=F4C3Y6_SPHS2